MVHKFQKIPGGSEEVNQSIVDSSLNISFKEAFLGVLKAPVLVVILDSLDLTDLSSLENGINNSVNSTFDLTDIYGPEVLVDLFLHAPGSGESWLRPLTEALVSDNISVGLVPSFSESSEESFVEFSVCLNVIKFLSVILWAVFSLLQHTEEWFVASLGHPAGVGYG